METLRVVIGVLGVDQHENGAVVVARMLRDAGMEVIYVGRYQTPETLVEVCEQEDADIIALSCHSWEIFNYISPLLDLIEEQQLFTPVIVGGSVLTPSDLTKLKDAGVGAAFGSGATEQQIVGDVRELGHKRRQLNL
jgi:methylmalonyl-CoA mutase, C-terminal domain